MKTRIIYLLLVICFSSANATSQDTWLQNIYVPNNNSQASPHSIVFNNNSQNYYIYTGQKILIVDQQSGTIENSINVGQTGYFDPFCSLIENNHKLAIDLNRNFIYCANQDDALKIYNCADNSLIQEFNSWEPLISSFLYYNSELDRIYWIQNSVHLNGKNRLTVINPDDWSNIYLETSSEKQIFDITFCLANSFLSNNYLVLSTTSTTSPSGYISLINPYDLTSYDSFVFPAFNANKLLYVEGYNRLYCISTNDITSSLKAFSINSATNQLYYLQNYTIDNFPIINSESACFVKDNFTYAYFTGENVNGVCKMVITDYSRQNNNDPIIEEFEFPGVDQVVVDSEEKVYSSGNTLNKLFGSTVQSTISINGTANHLVMAEEEIVLSNIEGNSLDSYNFSLNLLQSTHLGDPIFRGELNTVDQKIYWIPLTTLYAEEYLSIQNLSDNAINSIEIGTYISDIAYHAYSDKLIVANFDYLESKITIVDGYSNETESVASNPVSVIKPGINDKVYLGGNNLLKYLDMDNNSIEDVQNNNLNEFYEIIDFEILNDGNCVALATESGVYGCKLLKIDKNTNEISSISSFLRVPVGHRDGLFYNSFNNQLYLLSENCLTVINPSTLQQSSEIIHPENTLFRECNYSKRSERLIVMCKDGHKILFYNSDNFSFINQVELSGYTTIKSSLYNPINDLLYLHCSNYDNIYYKNEMRLMSIRCADFLIQNDIYLQQNTTKNFYSYTNGAQMVLDESVNTIFIPNEGLGNISEVKCSDDLLILQPGWNWLSYPRLDRSQGAPGPEIVLNQSQIAPDYNYLNMNYLDVSEEGEDLTKVEWDQNHHWVYDDLTEVYSERGYKLYLSPEQSRTLDLTGTVLDPEFTFLLYAFKPNWIGYFLPAIQSPFDAIPEEYLDKITHMAGQYWSCHKRDPLPPLKSSGSIWACACQQGRIELKYGDMIIISTGEEIDDFHWQYGGMYAPDEPKDPSLYFKYEEQPEYDALFIELDTLDLPDEIGAFAGDSCIGATTILPGDTLALICAYTEGFEGEEITFELMNPTKSARPRCRDYSVLNIATGIREKRRIVAGENQPYFLVSLKSQENIPADDMAFNVNVRPNPSKEEFTVSYYTGQEASVELSLINALGLPVSAWQRGMVSAGNYSMTIRTAGLPSGCFYLKVKAGNAVETQKILIIH